MNYPPNLGQKIGLIAILLAYMSKMHIFIDKTDLSANI
jgi:hypothetical protein